MSTKRPRPHRVATQLTDQQYNLARRRLFAEKQTWQKVLNALVNAYITGDITVTEAGRYHLSTPKGKPVVIQVPKGADLIEVDVDWGTKDRRPQVGADSPSQKPKVLSAWGTKDLLFHLRSVTGRRITMQSLRYLLRIMEIEKDGNNRWEFKGPEDERVTEVEEAIYSGLYDELVRMGTEAAAAIRITKEKQEKALKNAVSAHEAERKALHLKRLNQIEK